MTTSSNNTKCLTVHFGDVRFNPLTRHQALDLVFERTSERQAFWVVTSNLDHMLHTKENQAFANAIAQSNLIVPDGWPLVAGLRIMGFPDTQRVAGSDLLPLISERCSKQNKSIFIMGGMEGWAEKAAEELKKSYAGLNVAGCYFPPFGFEKSVEESQKMIDAVNQANPDFLFLGVGSPKQEIWIANHLKNLKCGVVIGVGAAIGFSAKQIQRAPAIMQKFGLEWFFRLCSEPKRLGKRYAKDALLLPELALEAYKSRPKNKP